MLDLHCWTRTFSSWRERWGATLSCSAQASHCGGFSCCGAFTLGFPGGSENKESACNAEDTGSVPGLGRSPGEGHGNLLQYSCLENPIDRGTWWATVRGVSKELDTTDHTHRASRCTGFRSFSTQAHGLLAELLHGLWNPPRPGFKPVSPAMAGDS